MPPFSSQNLFGKIGFFLHHEAAEIPLCSAKVLYFVKRQAFRAKRPDGCQTPARSVDNWVNELPQPGSGAI
jgi:hypothetical protein